MSIVKINTYSCESCDSNWGLDYSEDEVIGEPQYCPFCGIETELFDDDSNEDEEDEDSQ